MLSALGFTLRRWVSLADWKTDESTRGLWETWTLLLKTVWKFAYSQNREDRVDWNWWGCWLMFCDSHSICSSLNSMCCPFLLVLLHSSKPGSQMSQPQGDNSCERQRHQAHSSMWAGTASLCSGSTSAERWGVQEGKGNGATTDPKSGLLLQQFENHPQTQYGAAGHWVEGKPQFTPSLGSNPNISKHISYQDDSCQHTLGKDVTHVCIKSSLLTKAIKRILHQDQVGFTARRQGWFLSTNIFH